MPKARMLAAFAVLSLAVACGSSDDASGGPDGTPGGPGDPSGSSGSAAGPSGSSGSSGTGTPATSAAPAFDPLVHCQSLSPKGATSRYEQPVVTARIHTADPATALLTVAGADGTAYGVREGAKGPEIVRRVGSKDDVLATGAGTASVPGEWMLRLIVEGGAVRGKAWPAATHEPSAWQVSWAGAPPKVTKIALDAPADTTATYVLAGPATGTTINSNAFDSYVSCSTTMPAAPPPADGKTDNAGDTANKAEVKSLMEWAMDRSAPRLVVVSAGTSNSVDPAGIITSCPGGQCLQHRFEAFELSYASLRAAGYTDAEIADPTRVRFVMWGFGDTAKGKDLFFHTNGAGAASTFVVRNLGGGSAALNGPTHAPAANPIPYVGTFAYTRQHMNDDATRFRDAVNAYAKTEPTFAAHTLVVSHSWGAAYTTAMVLKEDLGFHVDLAMTVALPKIAADLNQLGSCATTLFLSGCPNVTPELDLPQGFYLAPGGLPLYRVDRPDDPVANAHDIKTLVTELQDVVGDGIFGGHDYVIRSEAVPTAKQQCARSYQDCVVGSVLCSTKHENVEFLSSAPKLSYVGMYGVDTFHVSCSVAGRVLEYRCDGVGKLAATYCKDPPGNGEKLCAAKPDDCP